MTMQVSSWIAYLQSFVRRLRLNSLLESFTVRSALFFAAFTLAFFARLLFNSTDSVWSKSGNDLTTAVIPWWTFGFHEMLHGNFPLWNPHNFCGTPFFSNFNPGMLYPVHLLCLLLRLQDALNVILTIHVALAGWFTSLWCRNRGVSALGSIVAGVIYMFSGAYFHHSYPGHESPLAAMSLAPLVFLSIDGIFYEFAWRWILLGMLAVGLQCLAGFPQAVYYTGLMSALYVVMRIVFYENRLLILRRFVLIYGGGAMIAAVQLLPGLQTAGESVRQGGNSFEFASSGALPPENLVHLLAPFVLGDLERSPYVGIGYPWELSVFCGASTLVLAGAGAVCGDPRTRRFATTLAVISLVLALGVNIKPVYTALFYALPLFKSFRVAARFNWFMTLYIAMLAGIGFDVLVSIRPWKRWPTLVAFGGAVAVGVLAVCCASSAGAGINGAWGHFVQSLGSRSSGDVFIVPRVVDDAMVIATGKFAAWQFGQTAVALCCMAGVLLSLRWWPQCAYLLAGVTIIEMVIFANSILVWGPMYQRYPANWTQAVYTDSAGFRYLHPTLEFPNTAMLYNFDDLYGYDPVTLKRYSDLIAITQDVDPDRTNFVTQIARVKYPQLFQMLRCHDIFYIQEGQNPDGSRARGAAIMQVPDPMPELQLVSRYVVAPSRDEVAAAIRQPSFNPRQLVVLESQPDPAPPPARPAAAPGWADVVGRSTDWLEIKAELSAPAILLVTDAYSKAWRARPLEENGPQPAYTVMPANYALRAIPLAAGKHHFILEYVPIGFTIGKWISIASILAWISAFVWLNTKAARSAAAVEEAVVQTAAIEASVA